jgi:hypothetical protein
VLEEHFDKLLGLSKTNLGDKERIFICFGLSSLNY